MGNSKWVHLTFVALGLPLAFVSVKTVEWAWGYFGRPSGILPQLLGIGIAALAVFLAWRREDWFEKTAEIVNELTKVTWPTRKETWAATVVVIITTIVFSIFLGIFDLVWSWATALIYS
jgi:preprotein translocase subunit SecE